MSDEIILGYINKNLSKQRYSHSVSVAETATKIGEDLGLPDRDVKELYTAGLCHDIAKELPKDEQIKLIEKHQKLSNEDLICRSTLHQLAGAYLARELFDINDRVFGMIRYHCTGSPDMTLCEKIIFISDYIEPLREHHSCVLLRQYFTERRTDLRLIDVTAAKCCKRTLDLLESKGHPIHPLTIQTYEKLKNIAYN